VRQTLLGVLCGIVLVTSSSFAAATQATPSPGISISMNAERIYRVMATVPLSDRKAVFKGLSPAMKAEVWRVHFRRFSAENALTPAQAAIMAAARELFSEDLYAISTTDPAWESQVHVPLQFLEESARNFFPRELLLAAFGQIGPADAASSAVSSGVPAGHITGHGLTPVAELTSQCTCTQASDMCFFGTCSGGICYFDTGCGFGWRYDCTATCHRD
jgi:hypothetical protein